MDDTEPCDPSPPYPGWYVVEDASEEIKKIEELIGRVLHQERTNPDAVSSIDVQLRFGGLHISIKKDSSTTFSSAAEFCRDLVIAHPLKTLSLIWLAKVAL